MIYSKYSVTRLEKPYITKCHNYSRRHRTDDPLSEFGCINKCRKDFWKSDSRTKRCLPIDLVFVMESSDAEEKVCDCTVKKCDHTVNKCEKCAEAETEEYKQYSTNCENDCSQDCYEEFYTKDMFELKDEFKHSFWLKYNINKDNVTDNQTIVFVAVKNLEEISYKHVPKTNEFDFFATLGGTLLSMDRRFCTHYL